MQGHRNPIFLEELARPLKLSTGYFFTVFKASFAIGMPPKRSKLV